MTIFADEIWYETARLDTYGPSTAGSLSGDRVIDAVSGELFEKIPADRFLNGGAVKKKAFMRFATQAQVSSAKLGIGEYTAVPSGAVVAIYAGADGANTINDSSGPMVVGTLNAPLSNGDTYVDLLLSGGKPLSYFTGWSDGSLLMINDNGNPVHLATTGTPTDQGGGVFRFALASAWSGSTIPSGRMASQVIEATNQSPAIVALNNSSSISLNQSQITVGELGAIHDTITLDFTSGTDFNVSSSTFGPLSPGATNVTTQIVNPEIGQPMLTISSSAWSGTAFNGDQIQITIAPSHLAFFVGIDIPAGTAEQTIRFKFLHDVFG